MSDNTTVEFHFSDIRYLSRKFLREFIALYKTLPSLWNIKSKLYYDRSQKNADYNVLVTKLQEVEPEANRAMVTQKINSMRSARRKEVMKIKQSIEAGAEIHKPKLWYFELMDFLDDQEIKRKKLVVTTETESNEASSSESPDTMDLVDPDPDADVKISIPPSPDRRLSISSSNARSESELSNPVVAFTHTVPKNKTQQKTNDESRQETYEAFGRYVAQKLKVLPFGQRVYLEKIINDAMFEAELGNLNRNCYVYVPRTEGS